MTVTATTSGAPPQVVEQPQSEEPSDNDEASPVVAGQGFAYTEVRRNFFGHNFVRPLTSGGVRQSVLALTSTAIGGGLLTLPYAMRLTGMGLGCLLLLVGGLMSAYSIQVLMTKTVETGAMQYGELVGKKMRGCGTAFNVLLSAYGFGVQVAYFNFVGDFLSSLGEVLFPSVPLLHSREFIIFAILPIVVPLSVPRSLSSLKYVSIVGAIALAYTSALIIARAPGKVTKDIIAELKVCVIDWNFFIALGNFVFAYNCHLNVCPVASELEVATGPRISKVSYTAIFVQIFFYMCIAVSGYLSFGEGAKSDILANYAVDDPSAIIARFALAATLLFALPINLNPTLRAFLAVGDSLRKKGARRSQGENGLLERPRTKLHDNWVARLLSAMLYTIGAATTACAVSDPSEVIGLTSAAIGTLMMFILPGFFAGDFRLPVIGLFVLGFLNGSGAIVMILQAFGVLPKAPA
ncbi:unnamed protein product [Amoebophrya sp. A25]|nr:unnamed protein product [Amoebophrya sp. A25]|eukprot:GSA25T00005620001.1